MVKTQVFEETGTAQPCKHHASCFGGGARGGEEGRGGAHVGQVSTETLTHSIRMHFFFPAHRMHSKKKFTSTHSFHSNAYAHSSLTHSQKKNHQRATNWEVPQMPGYPADRACWGAARSRPILPHKKKQCSFRICPTCGALRTSHTHHMRFMRDSAIDTCVCVCVCVRVCVCVCVLFVCLYRMIFTLAAQNLPYNARVYISLCSILHASSCLILSCIFLCA